MKNGTVRLDLRILDSDTQEPLYRMTLRYWRFAFLLAFMPVFSALAARPSHFLPPKYEVRAVWITTTAGLDWPRVSGKVNQQESLRRIVHDLHDAHFNTLFFQVRPRGDAYYRSHYEPWAEALTGTLGKDPEWDPCAFIIEEAHALGMEVHGWFNVFKVRGPNPVGPSTPTHVSRAHDGWTVMRDGEVWLDPGLPQVRAYVLEVALDLVRNYDLDGINFDFIRYPGQDFPDNEAYAYYGKGMRRDDWRRSNITAFVKSFAEETSRIKPHFKIGSSPYGVYRDESNNDRRGSYYWVYQDSYPWLQNGWHDYLCPQVYWQIGGGGRGEPDFVRVAQRWSELTAGRHIYIGVGAYRAEIGSRLGDYIDSSRTAGLSGQTFFRWGDIADSRRLGGRYETWALIPPMPWKDRVPPLTPRNIRTLPAGPNARLLHWDPPAPAADGDTATTYVIYRWDSQFVPFTNSYAILAILSSTQFSFIDTTAFGSSGEYFYSVTACDRMGNESAPTSVVQAGKRQQEVDNRK
jgi:uncharacterized lipoprotein YddW (UPF0748 family)